MEKYELPENLDSTGRSTSRKKCSCRDLWSDKRYGPSIRVHNKCRSGWRCTRCGVVR